ncbi:unnamed protein product [Ceutorhynchus assimilis]|uniref:Piezo non-specific cation channel cap domain-containing protein n=1 Tax=Ceutorhynchus assimilis TaxID=467358 RepID=A0A9P0DN28_9CUCU|nr:unnamed protein product [Ceutorhynchus assimilis]
MAEDVVVVKWSPHSLTQWKVSPGTHDELMKDLKSKNSITIRVEIQYTHVGHGGEKTQSSFVQNTEIPRLPNKQRQSLIDILNFENKTTFLRLPMVFPKFMLITKDAKSKVLGIIKEPTTIDTTSTSERSDDYISARSSQEEYFVAKSFEHDEDEEILPNPSLFRNLLISLKTGKNREVWWHMQEECDITDDDYFYYLKNIQHNSCDQLVMYTFNEKVFSKTISYITQSGIIGLYLLYFMIMVDFMRGCRVTVDAIWINDWPDPEGLWRKCREVYIARDMRNYELEEELFAELIFIMRSREVLIKLTRETTSAYNPPVLTGESKKTK